MIVWRGWGIVGFFAIGIGVGLTALLAMASGTDMDGATWQGIPAFLLVGAGVHYLGTYVNVTKPTRDFATARGHHLGLAVPQEEDPSGPPAAPPLMEQPPLDDHEKALLKGIRNRHTLFFIPLQWWGFILSVLGIGISLASMS